LTKKYPDYSAVGYVIRDGLEDENTAKMVKERLSKARGKIPEKINPIPQAT